MLQSLKHRVYALVSMTPVQPRKFTIRSRVRAETRVSFRVSAFKPAWSVARAYDCTCGTVRDGLWWTLPRNAVPQLMVLPTSLTLSDSSDVKAVVQCSSAWREDTESPHHSRR